jgi:hypothetical protein
MDSEEIGKIYLQISEQQRDLLLKLEDIGSKIITFEHKILEYESELHKINKLKNVFKNELNELVELIQNSTNCIKSCKSFWCC